ncbi:MAG: histidine kinase [Parafilimonas sp.]|nr:histidine kinase [Parafilimonas sp.]
MSVLKSTRTEWISFLVLMPLIDVITLYNMYGERIWHDHKALSIMFLLNYVVGILTFFLNVFAMHKLQQALPELKQTVKRVILIVLSHIFITIAVFSVLFKFYDAISLFGFKMDVQQLNLSVWVVIGMVMLSDTLWESEFIYKKYKDSIIEKEAMQQLSLQQEFDALKNQVNPHFLFNCFNTLSSLISEDKKQAENFLNELSKVYRYLLRNNEDSLSTLQDELNFIQSFYRLLKTRHGDAIQLQVEVDKKYYKYLLPSLSLQLLVENAVKHNVVSKYQPLVIDIFSMEGNKLAVNNNLQPKKIKMPSNKIGLANIQSKYELLKQTGYEVLKDTRNFTVVLPLIWNNNGEMQFSFVQRNNEHLNID